MALLPIEAMAEDTIKIGLFNRDAAIIAAEGKGFLKQENIRVEINTVTDSPTLLRNLIRGQYDLILNNADNVIAWAEGQGEDPQKNDFVIFLGGSQGVDQKLIVAPGIAGYPDLKGKVFAVAEKVQGQLLTLKYKDGEQKIFVPPGTPIVKNVAGDRSLLQPGTGVYIAAVRSEDGTITATRITAGIGGIMPPM